MGSVILNKIGERFDINNGKVLIVDKNIDKTKSPLPEKYCYTDFDNVLNSFVADFVFFCVKPQDIERVIKQFKNSKIYNQNSIFISIIAGKKINFFTNIFDESVKIIRTMPNLAIEYSYGIMPYKINDKVTTKELEFFTNLCQDFGMVFDAVDENRFDALTAIFGSGPGYIFLLQEIIAEIAVKYNIQKDLINDLVKNLFLGSALISKNAKKDFQSLRADVTSKKGVTESLIKSLNTDNSLKNIFNNAIKEAIDKSRQLS